MKVEMVFFSGYRSSRLVSREFLKEPTMRWAGWGHYFSLRSWQGAYNSTLWGDCRYFFAICFPVCYYQRYMMARSCIEDEYQMTVLKRWGPSVEDVRRRLSPSDQARARAYSEAEMYTGAMSKTWFTFFPGCPLPKKEEAAHH